MMIFISGGSCSGKSAFAEKEATRLHKKYNYDKLYYIATMHAYGEEGKKRVERHREMRAGKGFETVELYNSDEINNYKFEENSVILLECMSNLLANEMFDENTKKTGVINNIVSAVIGLEKRCKTLVIVSNEIFSDYIFYDKEMQEYIKNLGLINTELVKHSNKAVECVYGVEIIHK